MTPVTDPVTDLTADLGPGYDERYQAWFATAGPVLRGGGDVHTVQAGYPVVSPASTPWSPLVRPLAETTVLLVTSGGVHLAGEHEPFDVTADPEGDHTFRRLPLAPSQGDVRVVHEHYDHTAALQDVNAVYPGARLGELADQGVVGATTPYGLSYSGALLSARRVAAELGPALVRHVAETAAGAVVLVPVCPGCHQSATVLARVVERSGTPTVLVANRLDLVRRVKPPRALVTQFPRGATVAPPAEPETQREVLTQALHLLESTETTPVLRTHQPGAARAHGTRG